MTGTGPGRNRDGTGTGTRRDPGRTGGDLGPAGLDPLTLAECVANSVVLTGDPVAQAAAPDYWALAVAGHRAVVETLREAVDPGTADLAGRLARQPADPLLYRGLVVSLAELFGARDDAADRLAAAAWEADSASRLRVHVGPRFPAGPPDDGPGVPALLAGLAALPHHGRHPVDVAVVIPFRQGDPRLSRARNLAACLNALNDQSHPRDRYRIVLAETDAEPRSAERFGPACDDYVFGPNPGSFNKAWAVNVGVVAAARPATLLCLLDADLLVDRDFIARNVIRFRIPGTQAHWPFQNVLFLDEASSRHAVRARCADREPAVAADTVRGVFLRRPPGGCLWLRDRLFAEVGGMDERFAGWGGEDIDLAWRVDFRAGLQRHPDPLVHLHHARAPHRAEDGDPFYSRVRWCSWPPDSVIGDLTRYDGGNRA